jgi:DNA-binding transcriptional ArsR family regulator
MASARHALSVLSDETRRQVLECLRAGPKTVGEIAGTLPVSRPAVSQHLAKLKDARLVSETRQGTRHYFSIEAAAIGELRTYFDQLWSDALGGFAQHVERGAKPKSKQKTRKAER